MHSQLQQWLKELEKDTQLVGPAGAFEQKPTVMNSSTPESF